MFTTITVVAGDDDWRWEDENIHKMSDEENKGFCVMSLRP